MPDFLSLNSYDYHLPSSLIAQYPLANRTASRLLCLNRNSSAIAHHHFYDIVDMLQSGDVLVLNTSKVFPARLYGHKQNGTRIEVLLLNAIAGTRWKCMVNPGKRLKEPQWLQFSSGLKGFVSNPDPEGLREIDMVPESDLFIELEKCGHVPLPPYIEREDAVDDKADYQTVYAKEPGSAAAPTAGLHFSDELLDALRRRQVQILELVLHVGIGTFKPVKTEMILDHKMHSECCTIAPETAKALNLAKSEGRRIIAVGTTSLRTLESFWQAPKGYFESGSKWTDIFLHPNNPPLSIDGLITNFHLPKSSLLMLVCAFAGYDNTFKAYNEAIRHSYRFFSYGDAMFIS